MNRIVLAIGAVVVVIIIFLLVRPKGETKPPPADTFKVDTTRVSFDTVKSNVPPPAPDTFTPPKPEPPVTRLQYPPAPEALMEAVRREESFTQFCYQEFGQKSDPQLRGGVAMLVTVGTSGVTAAHVANDSWTSKFGKAVNRCLNQRAKDAWRLPAGAVKAGQYVVNLTFQPV